MQVLKYPDEVLEYIKSRLEQREFYKQRKETDPPETDIPVLFFNRAKTSADELLPLLKSFGLTPINSMLDIGCGFGATTAMLARELNAKEIHLIEGRGTPLSITGFNASASAWNDVKIAEKMVRANVNRKKVVSHYYDNLPEKMKEGGLDLITSFRSWGHHYPVSIYLEHVKRWLRPGGALVLDVRISKVEHEEGLGLLLSNGFEQLAWVSEHSASAKSKRLLFRYKT